MIRKAAVMYRSELYGNRIRNGWLGMQNRVSQYIRGGGSAAVTVAAYDGRFMNMLKGEQPEVVQTRQYKHISAYTG